ncbi:MAG: sigma-54-dependent Fis family transcriptional regulator [Deltaproteobacteria bacterium]|nr:sigma-54-dependent Fis family transcriptional regulator [Deltaproteobacteria bacterium]
MGKHASAGTSSILIVDDEELIRWSLRARLEDDGHHIRDAGTGAAARDALRELPDLVLLDMRLPDADGLDLLREIKQQAPTLPVVMMTGNRSVESAVQAMRDGALHYAVKPLNLDEIAVLVEKALATGALEREVRDHRAQASAPYAFDRIIGDSPAMQRVRTLLQRVARAPVGTVLITGESGTGKDLAAKAVHYNSPRAERPFMNITCSALQDTLLESELFGHERGAFTDAKKAKRGLFEAADGGTVFLDEIGETSPAMQAKLLRFLEEQTFKRVGGLTDVRVDVRVIAATNRDLLAEVAGGGFREDLYYRLRVLPVELPPLRERGDDVASMAAWYVARYCDELHRPVPNITEAGMAALCAHSWPGNVRELRNLVERAVLLGDGGPLDVDDFFGFERQRGGDADPFRLPPEGIVLEDLERDLVRQALQRARGNQSAAARLLGISRDQLRYRVEKFGFGAVTWA